MRIKWISTSSIRGFSVKPLSMRLISMTGRSEKETESTDAENCIQVIQAARKWFKAKYILLYICSHHGAPGYLKDIGVYNIFIFILCPSCKHK